MAEIIPLLTVPNQTLAMPLSNQNVRLNLYTRGSALYMDVFTDGGNTLIIAGVVCQDRNRIVRDLYLGFLGDFAFFDTQGLDDPVYTGVGDRWQLIYIEPSELPKGIG